MSLLTFSETVSIPCPASTTAEDDHLRRKHTIFHVHVDSSFDWAKDQPIDRIFRVLLNTITRREFWVRDLHSLSLCIIHQPEISIKPTEVVNHLDTVRDPDCQLELRRVEKK